MRGEKKTNGRGKGWGAPAQRLGLALGALLWLSGCSYCYTGTPILDADYGHSVANNQAQMVLNPQAGQNLTPAVGLDPKAGENTQDRYDKSFKGEEKAAATLTLTTAGAGK